MSRDFLKSAKNIFCIGIGGIGVSALARMFLLEGKRVSGSDISPSFVTEELKKKGAKIFIGHKEENLKNDTDLVIYTKAIKKDNPELKKAKRLKIKTLSYSQALGEISSGKYTVAISGSHGKTTTTGMIAWGLLKARKQPTVVVGSFLKGLKSNFVAGRGKYFVVEACEYQESFLDLNPQIIVVTNIDNDHLDYYKNLSNLKKAFLKFIQKLPSGGYLVCDLSDRKISDLVRRIKKKRFEVIDFSKSKIDFPLRLIGEHNLKNAQAAASVLRLLKVEDKIIKSALSSFSGTLRRFEYKGKKEGVLVYDDYAHHPTEIKKTLKAAKEFFKNQKITVVFQPHLYSRTKILFNDFLKSFQDADSIIFLPIYAAREKFDKSISSKKLFSQLKHKNKFYFDSFKETTDFLKSYLKKGDILLTMGAGDVYKIAEAYLKK
ncbi:MAG: UDP-N-acetylmuramate--L-alanine ligase [Candidatus Parcubacteria bacterium]|nr:UDP-N-acetylmuramate--L-alanine ligase [Patescibacteria group bacterium]BCX16000.1 MAG: UDP-N-acetylmuramate--L-alanine ligase [Candidatus Parcubacteria bacterium]